MANEMDDIRMTKIQDKNELEVQFYLDWFLDAKLCKLQNIK
jgi:hypothetical protein